MRGIISTMSDIEDGFCLPHNDTKFPPQPIELDKAIKEADWKLQDCVDYTDGTLVMGFRQVQLLSTAAKRFKEVEKALVNSNDAAEKLEVMLKEIEKERNELKHKLNVCKEAYSRDTKDDETYAKKLQVELTQLRAEYKRAVEALDNIVSHYINNPEVDLICVKVLKTPSAIAAMKGEA